MERWLMKEEQVTKAILKWLIASKWEIVCFDFPQSGTGRVLHPNGGNDEKNKDAIIPDIVAVKGNVCIFVEDKDRFYYPDFQKQNRLKTGNNYSDAIAALLKGYAVERIFYGIGLPTAKHNQGSIDAAYLVDFIICVNEDKSIHIPYNPTDITFN